MTLKDKFFDTFILNSISQNILLKINLPFGRSAIPIEGKQLESTPPLPRVEAKLQQLQ